ncbi:MAG: DUF3987 domain-containing protein [Thermomicrobiales bacterium]
MSMDTTPVESILARLEKVARSGKGWKARCPAHEDRHPSLSIHVGDDDRVLLHCHAGCPIDAILAALDLRATDLFSQATRRVRSGASASASASRPSRIVATYDYVDAQGVLRYQAVRREPKGFFQRRPDGQGGWINNLHGIERVLYRLPQLLAAPAGSAVWLPEGEKDVDALVALGLVATTAAEGAKAPWLPAYTEALQPFHVAILEDQDAAGRKRALTVARALIGDVRSVRIIRFPDLPPKGDVSDWLAAGHTRADLIARARDTPILTTEDLDDLDDEAANSSYLHFFDHEQDPEEEGESPFPPPLAPVPSFPVEVFPRVLRHYVTESAEALGVPVDMVAVPLLGFAAGVLGNSRVLRVKEGWITRPILWLAVIGDPGSGKSPALEAAQHPVNELQKEAWQRFQDALGQWEQDALDAKAAKQAPPEKPVLEHFLTTDATTEALAFLLGSSPGVVLVRDELVGWVKSHDAYRKAGDRQQWLSLWAGTGLKVDRRSSGPVYVPKPTAVVVGGIQPDLLPDLAEEAQRRDGFVDRLLCTWPDAFPQRWSEATVRQSTTRAAEHLFAQLRPTFRAQEPALHDLTREAKETFAEWFDINAEQREASSGLVAGCYAKYPGQCVRLALVLHCLREPEDLQAPVAEGTMLDAIAVVEYFRGHLARVLPAFGAAAPRTATRATEPLPVRVARLLQAAGGAWLARTELHRRLGGKVSAQALTGALAALVRAGRIELRSVPTGSKPREEWRWIAEDAPQADETEAHAREPHDPPNSGRDTNRRYEDMKYSGEASGDSSYLHVFADRATRESWQETVL